VQSYPEQASLGGVRKHGGEDEAAEILVAFGFGPSKLIRVESYDVLNADFLGVFRANAKLGAGVTSSLAQA
jgi:hypothetical protein